MKKILSWILCMCVCLAGAAGALAEEAAPTDERLVFAADCMKQIQELANSYHKHWVFVHNALTGEQITDSLTGIEYNVAKLAKIGMANQEIADFLGITVNSVRAHLRHIFNKLGIESRKELSLHVI